MARLALVIANDLKRGQALMAVRDAPFGTRVEIKSARRTTDQNAKMWVMLHEIAEQREHFGRKYPAEVWKLLFMHNLGRQIQFIPNLDGDGVIPLNGSSSEMSIGEMSELIESMYAWAAEKGVEFSDTCRLTLCRRRRPLDGKQ